MTFATEIAKRRTKRATLVRLKPGRYVSESLSSDGGGVYSMTFSYPIAAVKRNGTALTSTGTNPPGTNDYYYFDETSGTFKVKLAAAPSSTNVVVIYYYLFYTSGIDVEYYETPTDSATTMRYWKPALIPDSTFSESIEGLEAGVVTIPDASIELTNLDHDFRNYLTDNDSFSNKDIDIWHEVNGQFRKAYTGKTKSIDEVSPSAVVISFSNQTSLLDKTAFMGDDFDQCYHVSTSVPKKDLFKPIPLWIAEQSYYESTTSNGTTTYEIPSVAESAVCTSYNPSIATNVNRTWTLCRVFNLEYQSWSTIEAAVALAGEVMFRIASGYTGIYAGDTIKWEESGTTYYGIIAYVGNFTYSATTYNVYVRSVRNDTGASFVGSPAATTSSIITSLAALTVLYKDPNGSTKYACQEIEYSVNSTATTGSNYLISITFVSNAEANAGIAASETFNPENMDIQYKISANPIFLSHGRVLKTILEKAGVTVNSASFTTADSSADQDIAMRIPLKSESEYSSYLFYVQKILESMLGYLKQNDDGEISYHLLAAPAPTVTRDDEHHISELRKSVEYRDIITEIVAKNQHAPVLSDGAVIGGKSSSTKARYLHDTEKQFVFDHVLKPASDGTITRQAEILALRSNRRSVTTYRTETIDLDTVVGDEMTVESEGESTDNFVRAVRKSENETVVECDDLLGL